MKKKLFTYLLLNIYMIFLCFFCVQSKDNVDFIVVNKSLRNINIYEKGTIIKTFYISLGFEPIGHKSKKGDGKTPEGLYRITQKISNSSFFLALKISYPNLWDTRRALSLGENPGGEIMIHGLPNNKNKLDVLHGIEDWTNGCIALNNNEIKYLWNNINIGIPILIRK